MNNKKKNLIFIIFLIVSILILLLINNKQKTSFRYFIWNRQEVSIGKLIFISFFSGLFISSILNKTLSDNVRTKPIFKGDHKTTDDNLVKEEESNEPYDIAPERDLRDPQPTISVNYRIIKNIGENELKDKNQEINNVQYNVDDWNNNVDDWNNNDSEW
tara:strand:+ start:212 stop:688 length:477 start_codon:yes stop_codon:yes gene_type:complete